MSKKNPIKGKSKRKNSNLLPILITIIFAAVAIGAYVALSKMASTDNDYQLGELREGSINVYVGGNLFNVITNVTRIQQVVENIISTYNLENITFLMFGTRTCPHCGAMNDFFTTEFRDEYFVVWLSGGENMTWFVEIASAEYEAGFPEQYAYAVPQTLVLDGDGQVRAIVIGELTDKNFWASLLEKIK